jgi:hypothetical protein
MYQYTRELLLRDYHSQKMIQAHAERFGLKRYGANIDLISPS